MRVLCLHGMGTNSDIFRAQTEAFRALLPAHFSFHFFDAEYDCPAADGIGGIYPSPYLCFYPVPTISNVSEAHQLVWELIEEEGPFDAVMGFSQGAALAASVLLHHQISKPYAPPPFRLAIFICGSLPYSLSSTHGVDATALFASGSTKASPRWKSYDPTTDDGSAIPRPIARAPVLHQDSTDSIDSGYQSADSSSENFLLENSTTKSLEPTVHRFHSAVDRARIAIPTAHVYGRQDPYYKQSQELVKLCASEWVSTYEHAEGHSVPRAAAVSKGISGVIEKAVRMSEVGG